MKVKLMYIPVLLILILLSGCNNISLNNCPDRELYDFKENIKNRDTAIELLKNYFSEDNGYIQFNESLVEGPYKNHPSFPDGSYLYGNRYGWTISNGTHNSKAGGVLLSNGRIITKGYCK